MDKSGVRRLAGILKVLVTITFICNLVVLPMVPGMVMVGTGMEYEAVELGLLTIPAMTLTAWFRLPWWGWQAYMQVLILFLIFCGICTAVLLWQGRRVLNTILREDTFIMENAVNMRRAAVCCFLVSFAALARTLWGFWFYHSVSPLFTYNALFCPIALMGGLLCLVMSALFRQAAELKAENDLTI